MENKHHEKTSPKDVFTHLLAIITLYTSAGTFINLIFKYINLGFQDTLDFRDYWSRTSEFSSIRFAIATLVIVFPVYLITTKFLSKSYDRTPEKRNLSIRKWLIYLTLFLTAVTIIGDLVALVNNLLGGDLTIRFILKVITVLFVAGSVFFYYYEDLKKHKTE